MRFLSPLRPAHIGPFWAGGLRRYGVKMFSRLGFHTTVSMIAFDIVVLYPLIQRLGYFVSQSDLDSFLYMGVLGGL